MKIIFIARIGDRREDAMSELKGRKKKKRSGRRAGYSAELAAFHRAEEFGYMPIHSAASRGAADVVALHKSGHLAIQVKTTLTEVKNPLGLYRKDVIRLLDDYSELPGFTQMLWVLVKKGVWLDYLITEHGLYSAIWDGNEPILDEFIGEIRRSE